MATFALRPKVIDFESAWSKLELSIGSVISLEELGRRDWNDAFQDIYLMCVAQPEPLSQKLYQRLWEYLEKHVQNIHEEMAEYLDEELLQAYNDRWKIYYKGSRMLDKLFGHLNRQYVKFYKYTHSIVNGDKLECRPHSYIPEVGELALEMWCKEMVVPLKDVLLKELLFTIQDDRDGYLPSAGHLVKPVLESLITLRDHWSHDKMMLYTSLFESAYLWVARDYYAEKAVELWSECSSSQYLQRVITCLDEELTRSKKYLHKSSLDKVSKACRMAMIDAYSDRFYSNLDLDDHEQRQDMTNLYSLLKSVPEELHTLLKRFESDAQKTALETALNLTGDDHWDFIDKISTLHKRFTQMIGALFENDYRFLAVCKKTITEAVNYRRDLSNTYPMACHSLAKYTDNLLGKSGGNMTENELENKMEKVMVLLGHLSDKDVFERFYSKRFAQRLIRQASNSMDAEESMINKLKTVFDYEFTTKLQRMFTDIKLSEDLSLTFLASLQEGQLDVQMQVRVLRKGSWPLSEPKEQMALPSPLQPSLTLFENFYKQLHKGQKLIWLNDLATADVVLHYPATVARVTVTVTVPELAILLCFQQTDTCTLEQIEKTTLLTGSTLRSTVQSLTGDRLLLCNDKELSPHSVLSLNLNIDRLTRHRSMKIITEAAQRQMETEHTVASVQNDRTAFIECLIVRIMKKHKTLTHSELIEKVFESSQPRFVCEVNFIETNIQGLIRKEFIKQTEEHDQHYEYIA